MCILCGVFCVWIAAAGFVDECAWRAPSVACLSRVCGHACVCPACWLRGVCERDRRRDWSLRRRRMFEDVFWRIALTVLQFVLIYPILISLICTVSCNYFGGLCGSHQRWT